MYPYMYQNPYQVTRVNGENGAKAYQMPPNSSTLLVDENEPIVYLLTTDGAGYKSISAYDIAPHIVEPKPDLKALYERLDRLEGMLNESNASKLEQKQPNKPNNANQTNAERHRP